MMHLAVPRVLQEKDEREIKEDKMEKEAEQGHTFVAYPKLTWWQRIRKYLFPVEICTPAAVDFVAKDMLIINTVCELGIISRLRLMLTGRLIVETRTPTENVIGKQASSSVCYVATKGMINN